MRNCTLTRYVAEKLAKINVLLLTFVKCMSNLLDYMYWNTFGSKKFSLRRMLGRNFIFIYSNEGFGCKTDVSSAQQDTCA